MGQALRAKKAAKGKKPGLKSPGHVTPKVASRRWTGSDEVLSRAIPISREDLWMVLTRCPSLRAAAAHLSKVLGHEVKHQSLMEVLKFDPVLKEYMEAAEKRFAEQWPMSATEAYVMEHGWLHTQMRRRASRILLKYRWEGGHWPSAEALQKILRETYPVDRWLPKTPRRRLICCAGIPKALFDAVFKGFDAIPEPGAVSQGDPVAHPPKAPAKSIRRKDRPMLS